MACLMLFCCCFKSKNLRALNINYHIFFQFSINCMRNYFPENPHQHVSQRLEAENLRKRLQKKYYMLS